MRYKPSTKYKRVSAVGHPRATKDGMILEHILVAEKALGKYIEAKYPIHHHDTNGRNNANANLVICESRAYHKLLHTRMRILAAGGNPDTQKLCSVCRKLRMRSEFRSMPTLYDGLHSTCTPCTRVWFGLKRREKGIPRREHAERFDQNTGELKEVC